MQKSLVCLITFFLFRFTFAVAQCGTAALTGPTAACVNASGNIYTTDPGKSCYRWSVGGETIDRGSGINSVSVTSTSSDDAAISTTYLDPD